jgi:hypothetical protein
MVFYVTIKTFGMTLRINKFTGVVMDYGGVHPLAKILPSLVINL